MIRRVNSPWVGFCINALYGIYTGVLGLVSRSWWFIALAAYYVVLAVMRFSVLYSLRNADSATERFVMRFSGGMCLFRSVTLAGITYLSLLDERGTQYHEIVMITMALYAFSKITMAVIRMVQSGRKNLPALKCMCSLTLADAAVSIFALQRSMLVTFDGMSAGSIQLMNALTGTAVYLLTAVLGINLIGGKRITMVKSKIVQANEKIAKAVTGGYKKIENGVVKGYRKIENGAVSGYTKLEDRFIDQFLAREGETVEEARKRLKGESEESGI